MIFTHRHHKPMAALNTTTPEAVLKFQKG